MASKGTRTARQREPLPRTTDSTHDIPSREEGNPPSWKRPRQPREPAPQAQVDDKTAQPEDTDNVHSSQPTEEPNNVSVDHNGDVPTPGSATQTDMQLAILPAGSGAEDEDPFLPLRFTGQRSSGRPSDQLMPMFMAQQEQLIASINTSNGLLQEISNGQKELISLFKENGGPSSSNTGKEKVKKGGAGDLLDKLQEANCKELAESAFGANPYATREDAKTQLLAFFGKQAEADCWPVAGGMKTFHAMLDKTLALATNKRTTVNQRVKTSLHANHPQIVSGDKGALGALKDPEVAKALKEEMLVSTAAKPIPDPVDACIKLVYQKDGAKLTAEGIVTGLTRAQVWYAWGVMLWILEGNKSMPLQGDDNCETIMAEREAAVLKLPLQGRQFAFSSA